MNCLSRVLDLLSIRGPATIHLGGAYGIQVVEPARSVGLWQLLLRLGLDRLRESAQTRAAA